MGNCHVFFCCLQISQKKLKKFEKEYLTMREQQEQQEAPIERYEVENMKNVGQSSGF